MPTCSLTGKVSALAKPLSNPQGASKNQFLWSNNDLIAKDQFLLMNSKTSSKAEQIRHITTTAAINIEQLTHVDAAGKASMVDVTAKNITNREAIACATVEVGPKISKLISENSIKKGDVLTVSQLAGILAAKRTAELIPLCHNIALSSVKVHATLDAANHRVQLQAQVRCAAQTGVEMEALTAVTIAALTVYDMCKAVSHDMKITNVQLLRKTGGKTDFKRSTGEFN